MSGIRISAVTLEKVKAALQLGAVAVQQGSAVQQVRLSCLAALSALAEDASALGALSDRERLVFALVGQGKDSAEIASALGISHKTADAHKSNIRQKLGLANSRRVMVAAVRYVEGLGKAKDSKGEGSQS